MLAAQSISYLFNSNEPNWSDSTQVTLVSNVPEFEIVTNGHTIISSGNEVEIELEQGEHALLFRKSLYTDIEKIISINRPMHRIEIHFIVKTGTFKISSAPRDIQARIINTAGLPCTQASDAVEINHRDQGDLLNGQYRVLISSPGYVTKNIDFEIAHEQHTNINVSLEKKLVALKTLDEIHIKEKSEVVYKNFRKFNKNIAKGSAIVTIVYALGAIITVSGDDAQDPAMLTAIGIALYTPFAWAMITGKPIEFRKSGKYPDHANISWNERERQRELSRQNEDINDQNAKIKLHNRNIPKDSVSITD